MKRRGFLAIIAGAIGLPMVAMAKPKPKGYMVTVDWCRDSIEPDRHSVRVFQRQNDELKLVADLNDWLGRKKAEEMFAKFGASPFGRIKS